MTIAYVLAPSPQTQFTDNNGNWLPNGKVRTLDWDTRQPKATYYDPGGLKPRDNPFSLDSVGRAMEVYWENDSAYYLELLDNLGHRIWSTPEPFFPGGTGGGVVTNNIELVNLFVNGQMRFFPVGKYAPIPNGTTLIADGGWDFIKDGVNLNDSLEFVRFTPDNTDVDASPTYYLNYVSLGAGTGETMKDLTFRFQDVRTLANELVTVSLSLRSALLGSYPVEIFATQFFGSGGGPSASVITTLATVTPTIVASQYTGTVTLPSLTGKTIGTTGDDALYVTFRMPLNSDANLEMTDFYFKRGAVSLTYPYQSYEEVDATLKGLALPDAEPTTYFPNPFIPFAGNTEQAYDVITLIPNDGLLIQAWYPPVPIGTTQLWPSDIIPDGYLAAAGQTLIRAGKYQRLFDVPFSVGSFGTAYGSVADTIESVYPWSSNTDQFYIYNTVAGFPQTTWSAGNSGFTFVQVSNGFLPEYVQLGFVSTISYVVLNTHLGAGAVGSSSGVLVAIVDPGSPSTAFEWQFTAVAPGSIIAGGVITYLTGTGNPSLYIYFVKDGIGTDPMIPGFTGRPCNIESTMTIENVARAIAESVGQFESAYMTTLPAAALFPGAYFVIATPTATFQFYYQIDGSLTLPAIIVGQLVPIAILSSDTATDVALKTAAVFDPLQWVMPNWSGYFPRFTDVAGGADPDAASRTNRGDGTTGNHPGTYQNAQCGLPVAGTLLAAGTGLSTEAYGSGTPTADVLYAADTGSETRPINVYFTAIVKY